MQLWLRKADWFWLIYLLLLAWMWLPLWFNGQVPAFRDGFHYYLPQLVWLDQCYGNGEYFPSWNPNEGLGSSTAGQPSWQLYYPLRAVWLIPGLTLPQRLALFLGLHQILAAAGILRATRGLQLSRWSSWLAALGFSLSGPIVFQHTNLIYLCSAAWVGWALVPLFQLLSRPQYLSPPHRFLGIAKRLIVFVLACCMMILAGDPHCAANAVLVGLLALMVSIFGTWICRRESSQSEMPATDGAKPRIEVHSPSPSRVLGSCIGQPRIVGQTRSIGQPRSIVRSLSWIFLSVAIGLLTVQQFLSALTWFEFSNRAPSPPTVTDSLNSTVAEILANGDSTLQPRVFDFSLSPWSLPSLLWPTIGGHFQPHQSRWIDAMTSEEKMWVPSLYLGVLPFLLCLVPRPRYSKEGLPARCDKRPLFLLLMVVFSLIASLGNYSLGWIMREIAIAGGLPEWAEQFPPDSSLSLYGVFTQLVPGYDRFRYPAKWIVWMMAGIAILSATRFDQLIACSHRPRRQLQQRLAVRSLVAMVVSLLALGVILIVFETSPVLKDRIQAWMESSGDRLLGPLNVESALRDIHFALYWPVIVIVAILTVLRMPAPVKPTALVLLTAIDLAICNSQHWIVTTEIPKIFESPSAGRSEDFRWANVGRAEFIDFWSGSESDRLSAQLQLSQTFLLGKLCHLQGHAALHASASLQPMPIAKMCSWLRQRDRLTANQPELDNVLAHLGVTHRLVREGLVGEGQSKFRWQTVDASRPLCEFIPNGGLDESPEGRQVPERADSTPQWNWTDNQTLNVSLRVQTAGKLVVRQLNDRSWRVECESRRQAKPLPEELLLVIPLPSGNHDLRLTRQAAWQR